MVLEQLYSIDFLSKRPHYGLLLGLAYTIFGIGLAVFMFKDDPALIAVGITAIFLLPSLHKATQAEEEVEVFHSVSLKQAWKDNWRIIALYVAVFFGSFLAFAFFSLALPKLATNFLFKQQLAQMFGAGKAIAFSTETFLGILINNFKVLVLCFMIALLAGTGSILLIIWNASVWGTIFGNLAKTVGSTIVANKFIVFLLIMVSVLPHVFLEILAYILAVIAGTVMSDALARESMGGERMNKVLMLNIGILVASLVVLVLAAGVETYVLNNFETYRKIAEIAFT